MLFYLCTDSADSKGAIPATGIPDAEQVMWLSPAGGHLAHRAWISAVGVPALRKLHCIESLHARSMQDRSQTDYARTARAKGASEDRIVYGHRTCTVW